MQLRTHGLPVVPRKVAGAVARAVDEALTNDVKHAPGATVTVTIDGAPGLVEVRVEDTGAAGEIHAATPRRAAEGLGISQSLRGRMAAVGGNADVTSQAGVGTTVSVSWSEWCHGGGGRVPPG